MKDKSWRGKVRDLGVLLFFAFALIGLALTPLLYAYAIVNSCGWMGFFVECRITAPR